MSVLLSQPCTRRSLEPGLNPGMAMTGDPKKPLARVISFSSRWLDQVRYVVSQICDQPWWLSTKNGKNFKTWVEKGQLYLDPIPRPEEFPILVTPFSKDEILQHDLEQLELEESLLEEMIRLEDLTQQHTLDTERSLLNSNVPASSKLAPAAAWSNLDKFECSGACLPTPYKKILEIGVQNSGIDQIGNALQKLQVPMLTTLRLYLTWEIWISKLFLRNLRSNLFGNISYMIWYIDQSL